MREGGGASRLRTPLESRRMQNKATDAEGKAMRFRRYSGPQLKGPRTVLERGAEGFPPSLGMVHDPPERLYVLGNPAALVEGLAVVGARKATPYGLGCARRFARMAAERGVVVVSGGARGCDAEAHRAALDAGCPTVAFLGGGCDQLYPSEHHGLFQSIVDGGGAVVSEHPWDYPPLPFAFRARNRLIAGLARATLIVEAGLPSGTFSTADEALVANREVLVVPGAITSASSRGANRLVYQGATPIIDDDTFQDALFSLFGLLKQGSAAGGAQAAAAPKAGEGDALLAAWRPSPWDRRNSTAWPAACIRARARTPGSWSVSWKPRRGAWPPAIPTDGGARPPERRAARGVLFVIAVARAAAVWYPCRHASDSDHHRCRARGKRGGAPAGRPRLRRAARRSAPAGAHAGARKRERGRARVLQLAQGHEARQRRRHAQGGVGRPGLAGVRGRAAPRRACRRGARGRARRVLGRRDGASQGASPHPLRARRGRGRGRGGGLGRRRRGRGRPLGLGCPGRVARAPDRPGAPGVLRRRRAHRHGRLARPLQGVLAEPLRRRRGRLPERPVLERRVRRLRPCAGGRRARHPPRLRIEGLVPGMPAHRGSGARRTRRAALRRAQAGGPRRPAHGTASLGGGAAARRGPGRPATTWWGSRPTSPSPSSAASSA